MCDRRDLISLMVPINNPIRLRYTVQDSESEHVAIASPCEEHEVVEVRRVVRAIQAAEPAIL